VQEGGGGGAGVSVGQSGAGRVAAGGGGGEPIGDDDGTEAFGDFIEREDHLSCRPRASGDPVSQSSCFLRSGSNTLPTGVYWVHAFAGTTARGLMISTDYDSSSSLPPTGIFAAVSFCVMTRSKALPLRCHWPETSGVLVTFLTGWPAQRTGPTIEL